MATYHLRMLDVILEREAQSRKPPQGACTPVRSEGWPVPGPLGRGPPFCLLGSQCCVVVRQGAATAVSGVRLRRTARVCDVWRGSAHRTLAAGRSLGVCWPRHWFPAAPLATWRKGVLGLAIPEQNITFQNGS